MQPRPCPVFVQVGSGEPHILTLDSPHIARMAPLYYRILSYILPRRHSGFLTPSSRAVFLSGTLCPQRFIHYQRIHGKEKKDRPSAKKGLIESKSPFTGAAVALLSTPD